MKVSSKKYQISDKKQIMTSLNTWLKEQNNVLYFTTCYKARAVGVFVQYEIPDRTTDPYLYAADQGSDEVLNYVSQWINAIFKQDVVFRIEEREKVGFSIFITLEKKIQNIEVNEDDIEEPQVELIEEDSLKNKSEKRTIEEIVVTATSLPISRSMDDNTDSEIPSGIRRSKLPKLKVQSNIRLSHIDKKSSKQTPKKVGRKSEYNWVKLPKLLKKHQGSVTKIAKELGCSGPAVRRQIAKLKDGT